MCGCVYYFSQKDKCMYGHTLAIWNDMLDICGQVVQTEEIDKVKWLLKTLGTFSLKSIYQTQYIIARHVVFPYKLLWRTKMSLKVKAFSQLVI